MDNIRMEIFSYDYYGKTWYEWICLVCGQAGEGLQEGVIAHAKKHEASDFDESNCAWGE